MTAGYDLKINATLRALRDGLGDDERSSVNESYRGKTIISGPISIRQSAGYTAMASWLPNNHSAMVRMIAALLADSKLAALSASR